MGQKIKKRPGQKPYDIKYYINFTKNFFDQIPFFAISKNGQKSMFELGKSLKLPEMQFHEEKKMIHLISRVFLPEWFILGSTYFVVSDGCSAHVDENIGT